MSLSIDKLEYFLSLYHFQVITFYTTEQEKNKCKYIKIQTPHTMDTILLFIPSEYSFSVAYKPNTQLLKPCLSTPSKEEEKTFYTKINHATLPEAQRKNELETHLSQVYKQDVGNVSLKQSLKHRLYKQLQRFKYIIQGTQHSFAIQQQNTLGILSPETFEIEMYDFTCSTFKESREIFLIVDFKILHDKVNGIEEEIASIYSSFGEILNNVHSIHSLNIEKMIQDKNDLMFKEIYIQKDKYNLQIDQLRNLLKNNQRNEEIVKKKLDELETLHVSTLHHDMQKGYKQDKYLKEYQKIKKQKEEIHSALQILIEKQKNLSLETDEMMYENVIMMDKIFTNLQRLKEKL